MIVSSYEALNSHYFYAVRGEFGDTRWPQVVFASEFLVSLLIDNRRTYPTWDTPLPAAEINNSLDQNRSIHSISATFEVEHFRI